jgi:excisionase family DNA binding protein
MADTLTLAQAAERAGISTRTIYRLDRDRALPFPVLTIGRSRKVPVAPFERWLAGGDAVTK